MATHASKLSELEQTSARVWQELSQLMAQSSSDGCGSAAAALAGPDAQRRVALARQAVALDEAKAAEAEALRGLRQRHSAEATRRLDQCLKQQVAAVQLLRALVLNEKVRAARAAFSDRQQQQQRQSCVQAGGARLCLMGPPEWATAGSCSSGTCGGRSRSTASSDEGSSLRPHRLGFALGFESFTVAPRYLRRR